MAPSRPLEADSQTTAANSHAVARRPSIKCSSGHTAALKLHVLFTAAAFDAEASPELSEVDRNEDSDVVLEPLAVAFATAPDDALPLAAPQASTSLFSGGNVVIFADGSVTSVVVLTFLVLTHKQLGVLLVVQSAVPPDAEIYVTAKFCALSVFVAAMLASGVGSPLAQCV